MSRMEVPTLLSPAIPAAPDVKTLQMHLPEPGNSAERCTICSELLGLPRPDGLIETASMLPCSHIFGSICITQWLSTSSQHHDCPTCRRQMLYTVCRHPVQPCYARDAPKPVRKEDMPEKCILCGEGGEVGEKARWLEKRLKAEEKALKGLKVALPGLFGGLCRRTVESVEGRVGECRERYERDMEGCREGFQGERERERW